jgi:hypothetical protein
MKLWRIGNLSEAKHPSVLKIGKGVKAVVSNTPGEQNVLHSINCRRMFWIRLLLQTRKKYL